MTTQFGGNSEGDNPASRPEASLNASLAQEAPGLQVGQIPQQMRGPDTSNLHDVVLTAYTNVPNLIDPENGVHPVPEYTGFPYNTGYVPLRTK